MTATDLPQRGEVWRHYMAGLLDRHGTIEIGPEWDGHYLVKIPGTNHYMCEDADTILRAYERVTA